MGSEPGSKQPEDDAPHDVAQARVGQGQHLNADLAGGDPGDGVLNDGRAEACNAQQLDRMLAGSFDAYP